MPNWQRSLVARFESFYHLVNFGLRKRVVSALFVLATSVLCAAAVWYWHDQSSDKGWLMVDRWFTVVTLVIAVLVWFGEIHEDWEDHLPMRFDVYFLLEGSPRIVCKNALLPGEHDVRNLGQTIGQQMCGVERQFLKFHAATIRLKSLKNYVTCRIAYRRFQVVFDLIAPPEFAPDKKPPENHCLFWTIPGDSESSPEDEFKPCNHVECRPL